MGSEVPLGRLERVELRNIWQSESSHFTPWLARKENLDVLGETLGLDLEKKKRASCDASTRNIAPGCRHAILQRA